MPAALRQIPSIGQARSRGISNLFFTHDRWRTTRSPFCWGSSTASSSPSWPPSCCSTSSSPSSSPSKLHSYVSSQHMRAKPGMRAVSDLASPDRISPGVVADSGSRHAYKCWPLFLMVRSQEVMEYEEATHSVNTRLKNNYCYSGCFSLCFVLNFPHHLATDVMQI